MSGKGSRIWGKLRPWTCRWTILRGLWGWRKSRFKKTSRFRILPLSLIMTTNSLRRKSQGKRVWSRERHIRIRPLPVGRSRKFLVRRKVLKKGWRLLSLWSCRLWIRVLRRRDKKKLKKVWNFRIIFFHKTKNHTPKKKSHPPKFKTPQNPPNPNPKTSTSPSPWITPSPCTTLPPKTPNSTSGSTTLRPFAKGSKPLSLPRPWK